MQILDLTAADFGGVGVEVDKLEAAENEAHAASWRNTGIEGGGAMSDRIESVAKLLIRENFYLVSESICDTEDGCEKLDQVLFDLVDGSESDRVVAAIKDLKDLSFATARRIAAGLIESEARGSAEFAAQDVDDD